MTIVGDVASGSLLVSVMDRRLSPRSTSDNTNQRVEKTGFSESARNSIRPPCAVQGMFLPSFSRVESTVVTRSEDAVRPMASSGMAWSLRRTFRFIARGQAESPEEEGRAVRVLQVFIELKAKFTCGALFATR